MTEREKHRWIPVSERLPDNDNYVLVLKRSVYEPIVIAFFTSQFGGMSWIDCDNDCINTHDVLAWQKLPEIPEEYRHD